MVTVAVAVGLVMVVVVAVTAACRTLSTAASASTRPNPVPVTPLACSWIGLGGRRVFTTGTGTGVLSLRVGTLVGRVQGVPASASASVRQWREWQQIWVMDGRFDAELQGEEGATPLPLPLPSLRPTDITVSLSKGK